MSKNVLIISASPRKHGNSDLLCDRFMAGAQDAGHSVEKIRIQEKTINFCRGCISCLSHDGTCIQEDDMAAILEKMIQANVLVLATPVYFYNMDAQLKVLIDRTIAGVSRISDKDAYFIATSEDPKMTAMDVPVAGFRCFLKCLKNVNEVGLIYGTGVGKVGEIKGSPAMEQAYEMGKNV